jgi:hypothetical protein
MLFYCLNVTNDGRIGFDLAGNFAYFSKLPSSVAGLFPILVVTFFLFEYDSFI